jgi:RNA polymerase sigma factor (sigma-70 family)
MVTHGHARSPSTPALTVERSELERELARLHTDSWGWALACVNRDRDLAHEVLQTAYVRILSGVATLRGGSSIRTWTFGVIRMTALEELRRGRRSVGRGGDDAAMVEASDPTPGPDVLTERAERAAALTTALAALSPRQREVLHLVFYHGMTIEEAASVMKVSLGSARTHYKRAKAALALEIAHLREDVP